MMTRQNDAVALTDEQLEGVAGGIIPQPSLRPVHIQEACANGTFFIPRPPVGPCVTRGRASFDVGPVNRRR